MSTQKNLITLCFATVFTLGLAACGCGGGDAPVTGTTEIVPAGPPPAGPPPEEIAAEAAAAVVAATKAAATKLVAIGNIKTDEGLGGTTEEEPGAGIEGSYELSVKRDRMATTVTVTVNGAPPADAEKFTQAMDLGGGLTMHTRDGEMGVQEIAMVMTDVEEPLATAFGMVHDLNADEDGDIADAAVAVAFDPGSALVSTNEGDAMVLARMMSSAFAAPAEGSSSVTHRFLPAAVDGDPVMDGMQPREAAMVAGYYDGAMGTYTCTGGEDTSCTVDVNGKGELTAASDRWIFTPADGAKIDVPDMDFLSYGFWLKKTTKDGVVTYNEVAPFTMAHGMDKSNVTDVTGKAEYKGGATGVYVKNVYSAGGVIETATAGFFRADAMLMAYFGNPVELAEQDIPPNMVNTVTGTISNFALQHGEENAWSVALKGTIIPNDGTAAGSANGGGAEGSFSGTFYGTTEGDTTKPEAVAGEFNANFSNGSVAGAFGAREE